MAGFTEAEQHAIFNLGRAMMQRFEAGYFQFSTGLLNSEEGEGHRRWCASFLHYPVWKDWWAHEGRQAIYTQSFVDSIHSATVIPVTAGGILRDEQAVKSAAGSS